MGQPLSVNQLSSLTGRDRRTISTRLATLPFDSGVKGAHLYDSAAALAAIYAPEVTVKSLDKARTELAVEQRDNVRIKNEELLRTRIPLHIPSAIWDTFLQRAAATLKAATGKKLTKEKVNEILGGLREADVAPARW